MEKSIFQNVDCVSFYVDNIDEGIAFYSGALGLKLLWRVENVCGLGMSNDITEVVLVTEHNPVVQFKVESVEKVIPYFVEKGGILEYGPFEIDIGKCVVVKDRWENRYCLLDMSKGQYEVDDAGNVIGVK